MKSILLKLSVSSIISLTLTSSLAAEVRDAFIRIRESSPAEQRYTVPAGKTLIIQSIAQRGIGLNIEPGPLTLRIGKMRVNFPGSTIINSYTIGGTYEDEEIVALSQPLRLKAGEYIEMPTNASGSDAYYIFGLIADDGDLFAKIPVELVNPQIKGGMLMADVKYGSARPRLTKVETSDDLESFQEDPTGLISSNGTTSAVASVPATTAKKFMRVTATPRR